VLDVAPVAGYDTSLFQPLDPAQARRRGQSDPPGQFDVAQAPVQPKLKQYFTINRINAIKIAYMSTIQSYFENQIRLIRL
jgi:hypothetical protein